MPTKVSTVFCPRCDRPYSSIKSRDDAMLKMMNHAKKAHGKALYDILRDED